MDSSPESPAPAEKPVLPNFAPKPKGETVKVHNYAEARKACKLGQRPVLAFVGNGAKHLLMPTGQHVRLHAKDRTVSARQRRKDAKLFKRNERTYRQEIEAPAAPAQVAEELAGEIEAFGKLEVAEIVRMVQADELPFNVAMRLEQHGQNRQAVLMALAEIARPGDLEVIEKIGLPVGAAPAAESACPAAPPTSEPSPQ